MIRPALAVIAGACVIAAAGGATAQTQPGQPGQERPAAAAQPSNRRDAPDEPLQQTGPVLERRSERGQRAQESRLSDAEVAVAPVREIARTSRHNVTVGGRA